MKTDIILFLMRFVIDKNDRNRQCFETNEMFIINLKIVNFMKKFYLVSYEIILDK